MNKAKAVKTAVKIGAGVGTLYLVLGAAAYEAVLGRRFTSMKNNNRNITEDMYRFYGKPEDQTEGDAWFIAMHPEDTRLTDEKGKTLHANIFTQPEFTHKWCVIVHGYTSCPRDMGDQAMHIYKDRGYNVLLPHLVSFGEDTSRFSTMGYKDKDYVISWINYIIHEDPEAEICVFGESMGSATTMLVTGEPLPENVKCAVADCGYTTVWDEFKSHWKNMSGMGPFPVMYAANTVSKLTGGFDFKKCRPIDAVARSKTPTMFIHGEADDFVPYRMLDEVYNACTAEKVKLSVPGAHHAESNHLHPELYYPALYKFLDKYMGA